MLRQIPCGGRFLCLVSLARSFEHRQVTRACASLLLCRRKTRSTGAANCACRGGTTTVDEASAPPIALPAAPVLAAAAAAALWRRGGDCDWGGGGGGGGRGGERRRRPRDRSLWRRGEHCVVVKAYRRRVQNGRGAAGGGRGGERLQRWGQVSARGGGCWMLGGASWRRPPGVGGRRGEGRASWRRPPARGGRTGRVCQRRQPGSPAQRASRRPPVESQAPPPPPAPGTGGVEVLMLLEPSIMGTSDHGRVPHRPDDRSGQMTRIVRRGPVHLESRD